MKFNSDFIENMSEYEFPELPCDLGKCVKKQDLCTFVNNENKSRNFTYISQGTQTYVSKSNTQEASCIFDEKDCNCKNIIENLSCNCTRNGCLKKYCVCRKAGVKCGRGCHCSGCENC